MVVGIVYELETTEGPTTTSIKHSFYVEEDGKICIMLKKDSNIYIEFRDTNEDSKVNVNRLFIKGLTVI